MLTSTTTTSTTTNKRNIVGARIKKSMKSSSSAAPPLRLQKKTGAAVSAVAPSLPPNKVAELVRKLAEAQLETQRLRECVDKVQRENESLQTFSTAQLNQERRQHDEPKRYPDEGRAKGFVTTDTHGTDTVNNNETTNIGSSSLPEKNFFLDQMGSAPSSIVGFLPPHNAERQANQLPQPVTVAAGNDESQQWKRKYAKLKREHAEQLSQRDAQLAEVQHLVFQIHEEHDALRHRNERDMLQQQLEQESRERILLEQRARTLEEEAAGWRQRYLRLVEDTAVSHRAAPHPEGLNQTEPSFFCDGAPEQSQHQQGQGLGQQQGQQQQQQGQQQQQPPPPRERCVPLQQSVSALRTPPRRAFAEFAAAPLRSVAVQSDARASAGASTQTDERSRRAVGTQTETAAAAGPFGAAGPAGAFGAFGPVGTAGPAGAFGAFGPVGTAGPAGTAGQAGAFGPAGAAGAVVVAGGDSPGPGGERRVMESVRPRLRGAAVISHRGNAAEDHAALWNTRRGGAVDHRYAPAHGSSAAIADAAEPGYFAPARRRTFSGEGEISGMAASLPMARCESTAPVIFTTSNGYDSSRRERLEEDIRRHDHLLEAVAKLQRQAQRAVKTPSL